MTSSKSGMHEWPTDPSQLSAMHGTGAGTIASRPARRRRRVCIGQLVPAADRVEATRSPPFRTRAVPVVAVKGALGECGAIGGGRVRRSDSVAADAHDATHRRVRIRRFRVSGGRVGGVTADRSDETSVALVNSFASGGTNVSLVVKA